MASASMLTGENLVYGYWSTARAERSSRRASGWTLSIVSVETDRILSHIVDSTLFIDVQMTRSRINSWTSARAESLRGRGLDRDSRPNPGRRHLSLLKRRPKAKGQQEFLHAIIDRVRFDLFSS